MCYNNRGNLFDQTLSTALARAFKSLLARLSWWGEYTMILERFPKIRYIRQDEESAAVSELERKRTVYTRDMRG